MNKNELAQYIDHTYLKSNTTKEDIKRTCLEALEFNFKSVCIPPRFVTLASSILKDSNTLVCTVVGFPLGYNSTNIKVTETIEAIRNGAVEIDMVINFDLLISDEELFINEVNKVVEAADGNIVKVIIETSNLTSDLIKKSCKMISKTKAKFVKTSTGFGTFGANVEDVILMKESINNNMLVKASGGIKDLDIALQFISAGANRIGTSSGIAIIQAL